MSTDKRAYFKMDVGYLSNPKVASLLDDNPRAVLLHLECIAYSAQHLTNGKVPVRIAMRSACAEQCDVDAACNAGLLDRLDAKTVQVHDYLKHQRSAESVKGASEQAKRAARARWEDAERNADGNASGNADRIAQSNAEIGEREKREKDVSDADAPTPRDDVERICKHLADRVEANGSKRPTVTKGWRDAARLMLDRDGRDEREAHRLIDWCQDSTFWRPNVLSLPKFREKYDQLRLQAGQDVAADAEPTKRPGAWDRFTIHEVIG